MTNEQITTCIIIKSPPFSAIDGKEGIDLALVCAAFDQQVNLIFVEQGIFHLIKSQDSNCIDDKLHDKQLNAIEFYDIDKIYVESESLEKFHLTEKHLLSHVDCLPSSDIKTLCHSANQTVIF
ncbi:sulfurtransferase complex subunit TusC [Aliikangiella coralliicola]|uniref:Sulfurtransferase complex subunit TusC n=1 Tax=Aliikangiella coralliicola TaxID=2592383 RepID=A0A545UAL4_9GAMM|nr:sulfurtransferase complex subunit TusC [Aliikangiella coralliicola]TQV86499.1 sulfurtransferase complex subunit TusC [Aliikangiella coralliicola]